MKSTWRSEAGLTPCLQDQTGIAGRNDVIRKWVSKRGRAHKANGVAKKKVAGTDSETRISSCGPRHARDSEHRRSGRKAEAVRLRAKTLRPYIRRSGGQSRALPSSRGSAPSGSWASASGQARQRRYRQARQAGTSCQRSSLPDYLLNAGAWTIDQRLSIRAGREPGLPHMPLRSTSLRDSGG